jgi:DNA-binding transcriptional LysR family regulator
MFARHGVSPVTRVSADNEDVLRALVLGGIGVTLMREDVARGLAADGQVAVWDGERLSCPLRFVWNRKREAEPALRALIELVQAAWAAPATAKVVRARNAPPANRSRPRRR